MSSSLQSMKINDEICSNTEAEELFDDVLKLLGDFWTIRVLESLMNGPLRYCEVERSLKRVNPVTLTKRLKILEDNGYVIRHVETIDRQSVTYELTEKGSDTKPVIEAIKRFGIAYRH